MRIAPVVAAAAAAFALSAASASAAQVYAGQPSGASPFQFVMTLDNSGAQITGFTFHFDPGCAAEFRNVDFGSAIVVAGEPEGFMGGDHYLIGGAVKSGELATKFMGYDRVSETAVERMSAVLSGTVKPGKASGRVAVQFAQMDANTGAVIAQCSKNFAWKALRNPGFVYGGTTSQDEPVVVEVMAGRKQVSHAHVGWYAPCQSGGAIVVAHDEFDLRPFPLSRAGVFSKVFKMSYGDGSSQVERFAGKVGAKKASGTFQVDLAYPGETGAMDSCTSGKVSWKAVTG